MFKSCSEKSLKKYEDKYYYYNNREPFYRNRIDNLRKIEKYAKLYDDCLKKINKRKVFPQFGSKRISKRISKRKISKRKLSKK